MVIVTLSTCSVLIFIRSIVRLIEYLQGNDGYVISHEVFLYTLDGLLMWITMLIFIFEDIGMYYAQSARQEMNVNFYEMLEDISDLNKYYMGNVNFPNQRTNL